MPCSRANAGGVHRTRWPPPLAMTAASLMNPEAKRSPRWRRAPWPARVASIKRASRRNEMSYHTWPFTRAGLVSLAALAALQVGANASPLVPIVDLPRAADNSGVILVGGGHWGGGRWGGGGWDGGWRHGGGWGHHGGWGH